MLIALLNLSVLGFSFVVFYDKAKRTQQGNLLGIIPAWASDDSVGTEPPRGPDTLLHMCTLMEGDETQHDARPHICFFGLYTCVLVRLFSLCASFVTFLY